MPFIYYMVLNMFMLSFILHITMPLSFAVHILSYHILFCFCTVLYCTVLCSESASV